MSAVDANLSVFRRLTSNLATCAPSDSVISPPGMLACLLRACYSVAMMRRIDYAVCSCRSRRQRTWPLVNVHAHAATATGIRAGRPMTPAISSIICHNN